MGYRATVAVLFLFVLCDVALMTLRPAWNAGGMVMQYVLVAAHVAVGLCQGAVIFVLFANTIWFTAGLLGELTPTVRGAFPLWVLRLAFMAVPWAYRFFVADDEAQAFAGVGYPLLYAAEMLVALAFWVALFYTSCCMTERTMYAPYHRDSFAMLADARLQDELARHAAPPGSDSASDTAALDGLSGLPGQPDEPLPRLVIG